MSDSQNELAINNKSDISTRVTSPRSILNTKAVSNTKRSAEKSLYVKRGTKSKMMEDAVNAIKGIAEENVPPPNMDTFDMLGAYIASKLRSMTPNDREYYEKEILKVLTLPKS